MRVVMVGTGYVGLVSGVCFADFGHEVVCVDKDPAKIDMLNSGGVPIYEPGLEDLVSKNVEAGRLSFTTDLKQAMVGAAAVFIAVGTPSRRGDGHADLSYVYAASEEIAENIEDFTVDSRAQDVMRALYRPLFINETPILFTSRRTSELIKYAANSFLATKITFINEMADLCESVGANVECQ